MDAIAKAEYPIFVCALKASLQLKQELPNCRVKLRSPPWTTRSPTARYSGCAARVDYSLHRLYHYTGTDPEHFQNFVIFTNYQFYVDIFARLGHEHMERRQPHAVGILLWSSRARG